MNKSNALDWMLTSIWFLLILLFIDALLWFGSTSYFVISGIVMLVGIIGMLLTLSWHDGVRSPRFALSAVIFAGGAVFALLPFV